MKERSPSRGGTGGRGHPGLRGQPEPSQTWMVQGGGEREGAAVPQCWIAEGATMMRRRSFCWNNPRTLGAGDRACRPDWLCRRRVIVVEASYRTIEAARKAEIDRLRH